MPTQEPTGIDLQDRVDFENEWNKIKQRYSNKKWFSDLQHIQDKDSLIKVIDNQRKRNVASDERSKLKAKVYKVMDALVNLLELYSPMFEALKQVNPHGVPAGGIIYGCFFVLVKIVQDKKNRRSTIEKGLTNIQHWLNDLFEYRNMYSDSNTLRQSVCFVYKQILHFVVEVSAYYSRSRTSRLWIVLTKPTYAPFKVALDGIDDAVRRALVETVKLLHRNVVEHRKILERVKEQGEHNEAEKKVKDDRDWKDELVKIRSRLGCPSKPLSLQSRLEELEAWESSCLQSIGEDFNNMERSSIETLQNNSTYKEWDECSDRRMLIILALNHGNANFQHELWLSPGLVNLGMNLENQGTKLIYYTVRESKDTATTIISAILGEILAWDLNFFNWEKQLVKNALHTKQDGDVKLQWRFDILEELLAAWFSMNRDEEVYLIIERADRCVMPRDENKKACLKTFLLYMMKVLAQARGKFKILILADESYWPRNWDVQSWSYEYGESILLVESEWRQGSFM